MRRHPWVFATFLLAGVFLSGCIRLSADAGYAWKGPQDETMKTKKVGLDTQDLVPGAKAPGSIET